MLYNIIYRTIYYNKNKTIIATKVASTQIGKYNVHVPILIDLKLWV